MTVTTQDVARLTGDADGGPERPIARFLSRADVARHLGLKNVHSLSSVTLPPHDAEIGRHKGWTEETIDDWDDQRPGRGNWGPRDA